MQLSTQQILDRWQRQRDRNLVTWYLVLSVIVISLILLIATTGHAATITEVQHERVEACLDPKNLPDNLRRSYEKLKKSGHDVRISCTPKQKPLTAEQLMAIESLR